MTETTLNITPSCYFHQLRTVLRDDDPSIAIKTWYPQLWTQDSEKEFHPFFPVEKLRARFRRENFDHIFHCPCNKCLSECERARKYNYLEDFEGRNIIKQLKNNILSPDQPDLCRIFGLLIECRIPRYITIFSHYLRRRKPKDGKFTRKELKSIVFSLDDSTSFVLTQKNLDWFLKRQDYYFEEPIPWGSGGATIKRIDDGCSLPIMSDVTTCRPNREGGTEGHVLAFNIFPDSLTKIDFNNNMAALLGDEIEVDLEKPYPFVIKIFKNSGEGERDMQSLKIKLQEYEAIRSSQRKFEQNRDLRDFICMDVSSFVYGSEYCMIYPKALGSLEDFYNDPPDEWGNITSSILWRQLAKVGEGIDFIHGSLHMQHLDLKPSNILIFGIQSTDDSESERDAEGELTSARRSEISVNSSHHGEPVLVQATGEVLFRISDLGHRTLQSNGHHERASSSTSLGTPMVLGDWAWGPPEWSELRAPSDSEAYELYDYWNFGAILLEAAVYDTCQRSARDGSINYVGGFRNQRREEDGRSRKFYTVLGTRAVLKYIVSEKLQALRQFRYQSTENPPGAGELPAEFYHHISGEIERLLSIDPKHRRRLFSPNHVISINFSRPKTGTGAANSPGGIPSWPKSPGQSQPPQSPPPPGTPVPVAVEPPRAQPNQVYYFLDPPAYEYLSGAWVSVLGDPENNSRVWISKTVAGDMETRGIWEYTPATNRIHSYAGQSISLPSIDLHGFWSVTATDGNTQHWKFGTIKEGLSFFEHLSGINYYAGPFKGAEVTRFAVSIPSGKPFKFDKRVKVEKKPASLWFLTDRPAKPSAIRAFHPLPSSSQSIRSNHTGMSHGSIDMLKNIIRQAWLFIVPHYEDDVGQSNDTVSRCGFIFNITMSISIEQNGKQINLKEDGQPRRQAVVLDLPPKLKVPFRNLKAESLLNCYGETSFLFPDENCATEFRQTFLDIKALLKRSNTMRRATRR